MGSKRERRKTKRKERRSKKNCRLGFPYKYGGSNEKLFDFEQTEDIPTSEGEEDNKDIPASEDESKDKEDKKYNNGPTEKLFDEAVNILISEGMFDESFYSRTLDSLKTDRILIKSIRNGKKKVYLLLYLQIKRRKKEIKQHKNVCPSIPVIVIAPDSSVEEVKKEIVIFFLENFQESIYYEIIKSDFRKYLNGNGNGHTF